LSLSAA